MPFDVRQCPNAVTFQWLIDRGLDVGLHCHPCGRLVVVPVCSLPFALETPVPAVAGRFKCTRRLFVSSAPPFGRPLHIGRDVTSLHRVSDGQALPVTGGFAL